MPATLTYPGVYLEEIPSGVRTITGVATSVAAFVDYFRRGLIDKPVRVFSFGDFEREFGGLDRLSEASYAIQQFFQNGGSEAWVVRSTGTTARAAFATLLDGVGGAMSLTLEAGRGARTNPGAWGNQLRVQVEPIGGTRFNLSVLLVEPRNRQEAVVASEQFLNLSTAVGDPRNGQTLINDEISGSKLVRVTAIGPSRPLATGTVSGDLSAFPAAFSATLPLQVNVAIGSEGSGTARLARVPTTLAAARGLLESAIRQVRPDLKAFSEATVTVAENRLRVLAGPTVAGTQITFSAGGTDPTAASLGLVPGEQREGRMSGDVAGVVFPPAADLSLSVSIGVGAAMPVTLSEASMATLAAAAGEFETVLRANPAPEFAQARVLVHSDGAQQHLIVLAGTSGAPVTVAGADAPTLLLDNPNSTAVRALVSADLAAAPTVAAGSRVAVTIGTDGPHTAQFPAAAATLAAGATQLQAAIRTASTSPAFTSARVAPYDSGGQSRLVALAGAGTDAITFSPSPSDATTVTELRLTAGTGATANVQRYAFGNTAAAGAQPAGVVGTDVLPDATAMIGDLTAKTALHALEEVDIFNILCIPRATMVGTAPNGLSPGESLALLSAARDYCERRRAFLLIDTPRNVDGPADFDDPEEITGWLETNAGLRSRNVALYYPRVRVPDPLDEFRLRSIGACGTVAGLFARTDATRGVWKAPAGTDAVVRNVSELGDLLSDQENGTLNPLAINCLRNFPIFGNVVWGARTLEGSDQAASEWKYIPVRRVALFIEESLFRALKWVVFEPNDEPLWAQIRLNIGAFMQQLFRQGAFQGSSPREAYFVKCDRETTTQTDINLGIVNILVGFAPLKPAEFVVIKLQQIAGQIAT